jgi:predicted esterase
MTFLSTIETSPMRDPADQSILTKNTAAARNKSMLRPGLTIAAILIHLCFSEGVYAQVERSELGKRLRRFEEAWQTADDPLRIRSTPPMQAAVQKFFSFDLKAAGGKLDEAWFAVRSSQPPSSWERGVISFGVRVSPLVCDSELTDVNCSLQPFYDSRPDLPGTARVRYSIVTPEAVILSKQEFSWDDATRENGVSLNLKELPPGDFQIKVSVHLDTESVNLLPTMVSRVDQLERRLNNLEKQSNDRTQFQIDSIRATVGNQVSQLRALADEQTPETDLPASQLLSVCESIMEHKDNPQEILLRLAGEQDLWMSLAKGRLEVPVRLRAPATPIVEGRRLPVLMLFHGAGGSENMFFETYGAGDAVREGLKRGWLVVAPRQNLLGISLDCAQMLDALEELFPIDRNNVFLLGHSMGAAQVVRQVRSHPELPRAAVALGGGNRPFQAERISTVPWFIAAGELDFGRKGATALTKALQENAGKHIVYKEYPNVEHMVIVQAALPDAFAFFDQHLIKEPAPLKTSQD